MRIAFVAHSAASFRWVVAVICLMLAAGCGRDSEIKTYRVAKEDNTPKVPAPSVAEQAEAPMAAAHPSMPVPKLSWTLPKGWKELPADTSSIRKASFQVSGPEGKMAQVMIIPLPGVSNIELESVNMWREELGLKPLNREELTAQAKPVEVGDAKGDMFEMVNAEPQSGKQSGTCTLGAIAEREGILWFAKITGADDLVVEQKPAFIDFLKSLTFEKLAPTQLAAAERPASTNARRIPSESDAPKWKIPANWQEKTPGPMVTAAYTVTDAQGQADVSISKFPGPVGNLSANVNRWRGQLGLQPLDDAEAEKSAEMVEINGKKNAYMVDLKGAGARAGKRMVALGVPRDGDTWFYKLIGDEAVVTTEKDPFLKFVLGAY